MSQSVQMVEFFYQEAHLNETSPDEVSSQLHSILQNYENIKSNEEIQLKSLKTLLSQGSNYLQKLKQNQSRFIQSIALEVTQLMAQKIQTSARPQLEEYISNGLYSDVQSIASSLHFTCIDSAQKQTTKLNDLIKQKITTLEMFGKEYRKDQILMKNLILKLEEFSRQNVIEIPVEMEVPKEIYEVPIELQIENDRDYYEIPVEMELQRDLCDMSIQTDDLGSSQIRIVEVPIELKLVESSYVLQDPNSQVEATQANFETEVSPNQLQSGYGITPQINNLKNTFQTSVETVDIQKQKPLAMSVAQKKQGDPVDVKPQIRYIEVSVVVEKIIEIPYEVTVEKIVEVPVFISGCQQLVQRKVKKLKKKQPKPATTSRLSYGRSAKDSSLNSYIEGLIDHRMGPQTNYQRLKDSQPEEEYQEVEETIWETRKMEIEKHLCPYKHEKQTVIVETPIVEEKNVEKIIQIPLPIKVEVQVPIFTEVPIVEVKQVEVPIVLEKIVEVPLIEEKIVQVPIIQEKIMETPLIEEKIVEVPVIVEKYIEIPMIEEKIVQVPVIKERVIEVPVIQEKIIEVPIIQERIIEVPIIEEKIIEVPVIQDRIIEVPILQEKIFQRFIEVPVIIEKTVYEQIHASDVKQSQILTPKILQGSRNVSIPSFEMVAQEKQENIILQSSQKHDNLQKVEKGLILKTQKMDLVKERQIIQVPTEVIIEKYIEIPVEIQKIIEVPVITQKIIHVEVPVEIERIVEKIIEVPVVTEKIVYVQVPVEIFFGAEKVVEIPNEIIIQKEIPVEMFLEGNQVIEVPIEVILEKQIEKPIVLKELIEVPQIISEVVVQKPVLIKEIVEIPQEVIIEKEIQKPVVIREIVKIPYEVIVEKEVIIEKPVVIREIVEVPYEVVIEKIVEKPVFIEKVIQVPMVQQKIVEVPLVLQTNKLQRNILHSANTEEPILLQNALVSQENDQLSPQVVALQQSYQQTEQILNLEVGHNTYQLNSQQVIQVPVQVIVQKVIEKIIQVPVVTQKIVKVQVPVEIQKIVYVDRFVEVPVEVIIEREVPVQIIVEKQIEVPVEIIVEKEVVIEKPVVIREIVEIPYEIITEKFIEKPVVIQEVVKQYVEVPYEVIIEKIVQVPVITKEIVRQIVQVPYEVIIEKQVLIDKPVIIREIVEVPTEIFVEREIVVREAIEVPCEMVAQNQNRKTEVSIENHQQNVNRQQTELETQSLQNGFNIDTNNEEEQLYQLEANYATYQNQQSLQQFSNQIIQVPTEVYIEIPTIVEVQTIVEKPIEVIIEKIVQVIKEVPIEIIVEKIKEVPVEIQTIVEVPVEVVVQKIIEIPVQTTIQVPVQMIIQKVIEVEKIVQVPVEIFTPVEKVVEVVVKEFVEVPVEILVQKIVYVQKPYFKKYKNFQANQMEEIDVLALQQGAATFNEQNQSSYVLRSGIAPRTQNEMIYDVKQSSRQKYEGQIIQVPVTVDVQNFKQIPVQIYIEQMIDVPISQTRIQVPVEIVKYVDREIQIEIQKIVEVPIEVIIEKPVEVIIEKIVQVFVEVPVEIFIDRPVEKVIEVPIEVLVEKPIEVIIEKPIQVIVQKPVEIIVQKIVEVPVEIFLTPKQVKGQALIHEEIVNLQQFSNYNTHEEEKLESLENAPPAQNSVSQREIIQIPIQIETVVQKMVEVPVEIQKIIQVSVQIEKIVQKVVEIPVEIQRIIEVPIYLDKLQKSQFVQVPIEIQIMDKNIFEIPVEIEVQKTVQVPVEMQSVVEKIIQVPIVIEKIVEVPVIIQKLVQVPVQIIKIQKEFVEVPVQIQKIVYVDRIVEKNVFIEVPVEIEIQKQVQVPVVLEQVSPKKFNYLSSNFINTAYEQNYFSSEQRLETVNQLESGSPIHIEANEDTSISRDLRFENNPDGQVADHAEIIEVPIEIIVEKIVEIPVEIEKIVQVPVQILVEKVIEIPIEIERIVQVPVEIIVEKNVEIPIEIIKQVQVTVEIIKQIQVPVEIIRQIQVPVEIDRIIQVPVEIQRRIQIPVQIEKRIEVPVQIFIEKTGQIPVEIQKIIQVPVEIPIEVVVTKTVQIPVEIEKIVEKIIEVPVVVQKIVEVPVTMLEASQSSHITYTADQLYSVIDTRLDQATEDEKNKILSHLRDKYAYFFDQERTFYEIPVEMQIQPEEQTHEKTIYEIPVQIHIVPEEQQELLLENSNQDSLEVIDDNFAHNLKQPIMLQNAPKNHLEEILIVDSNQIVHNSQDDLKLGQKLEGSSPDFDQDGNPIYKIMIGKQNLDSSLESDGNEDFNKLKSLNVSEIQNKKHQEQNLFGSINAFMGKQDLGLTPRFQLDIKDTSSFDCGDQTGKEMIINASNLLDPHKLHNGVMPILPENSEEISQTNDNLSGIREKIIYDEDHFDELEKLRNQLNYLHEDNESNKKHIAQLSIRNQQLQEDLQNRTQQVEDLSSKILTFSIQKDNQILTFKSEKNEVENLVQKLKDQNDQLKRRVQEIKSKYVRLEEKHDLTSSELSELKVKYTTQIEILSSELLQKKTQLKELKTQEHELRNFYESELNVITEQLKKFKLEIERLEEENIQKQTLIEKLNHSHEELRTKLCQTLSGQSSSQTTTTDMYEQEFLRIKEKFELENKEKSQKIIELTFIIQNLEEDLQREQRNVKELEDQLVVGERNYEQLLAINEKERMDNELKLYELETKLNEVVMAVKEENYDLKDKNNEKSIVIEKLRKELIQLGQQKSLQLQSGAPQNDSFSKKVSLKNKRQSDISGILAPVKIEHISISNNKQSNILSSNAFYIQKLQSMLIKYEQIIQNHQEMISQLQERVYQYLKDALEKEQQAESLYTKLHEYQNTINSILVEKITMELENKRLKKVIVQSEKKLELLGNQLIRVARESIEFRADDDDYEQEEQADGEE